MINSEFSNYGSGNSGSGIPTYRKQPAAEVKKIPLRDVQNDNTNLMHKHQEKVLFLEGGHITDATKVIKGPTTEFSSSPPFHPSLRNNIANDHLVYARRKFECELDKGSIQDKPEKYADLPQLRQLYSKQQGIPPKQTQMRESDMHCVPVASPNHMSSVIAFSSGGQSLPNFLGKPSNGLPGAESNCLKINSEVPHSVDFKGTDDLQWKERFIHLQEFLKQCDESNQNDYIQMLLQLSPAELSRHAVELEKRAIQLTIEEGKEMQRVRALNILGKSGPANNSLHTNWQPPQSKK